LITEVLISDSSLNIQGVWPVKGQEKLAVLAGVPMPSYVPTITEFEAEMNSVNKVNSHSDNSVFFLVRCFCFCLRPNIETWLK